MVVNRLQNDFINSRITPTASRLKCQNIFFKWDYILFLDRDFNSENNNVSQVPITSHKKK
jgi:hypothetical protein